MVVHNHADPSFAHHEEAVVSDSIFRQAVGTTLRSVLLFILMIKGLVKYSSLTIFWLLYSRFADCQ